MVVIRLSRHGANKRPFYHIVVADKRRARDGRYIEKLGYFNPQACGKDIRLSIDKTRVAHWVGYGAEPSERVIKLIAEFDQGLTAPKEKTSTKYKLKKKAAKKAGASKNTAEATASEEPAAEKQEG